MGDRWFEPLRPLCKETCVTACSAQATEVVLFYLARWCQKETNDTEPDPDRLNRGEFRDTAENIARNLVEGGATVDRLVQGDAGEWTELRRRLVATARARAGAAAGEFADEAAQKIALVLLTGTQPAAAAERLRGEGPDGPANEYIFTSPFSFWAQTVVKNLVIDRERAAQRERAGPPTPVPRRARSLDRKLLRKANEALPGLLEAIRELPPAQRAAMTASLARGDLDEVVRERLHELAPDLFSEGGPGSFSCDEEVAAHLGTTPRRLAANRSAARRKLARRDSRWALLLDALLPHRSTRPVRPRQSEARPLARSTRGSDG